MTIRKQKILMLFMIWMLALTSCSSNPVEQITPTPKNVIAPPGPASVPVIPNASQITGKILSVSNEDVGVFVELLVVSSDPIPGFGNFGANVVGTQIKAKWMDAGGVPSVTSDQTITGELRYQGDEKTGMYLLSQVSVK